MTHSWQPVVSSVFSDQGPRDTPFTDRFASCARTYTAPYLGAPQCAGERQSTPAKSGCPEQVGLRVPEGATIAWQRLSAREADT
jgi:hypothetical protein